MKKINYSIIILFSCYSYTSIAQTGKPSLNDTITVYHSQAPVSAPVVMAKEWNQFHNKYLNLNIGLVLSADYNIVSQDANNVQQVGSVNSEGELRGDRIIFSGNLLFFKQPWRYQFTYSYNSLDTTGAKKFSWLDWNLEIPISKKAGWITLGKQKEGVGYEYLVSRTQGMFTERGSGEPVFVRQRNIGIKYGNSILNQRMTYTLGLYNNWFETGYSFKANGSQIVARSSALPIYKSDRQLLHIAAGYRYTGATDSSLSYSGKPEVHTAPSYVKTGGFSASSANSLMLEFLGVKGPLSILAEYMNTWVNRADAANPDLNFFQLAGSWFITGENRQYNKLSGNQTKIIPRKNFRLRKGGGPGAFELGARYSKSNLTSQGIEGGRLGRFTGAVSWYPNAHFRLEINYGAASLNKKNLIGEANFWQFRLQFEI